MSVLRMDHVGVVVSDLEAAVAFFSAVGLSEAGSGPVSGAWVDRIVGLEGVRAELVFLQTPDGHGRLELVRFDAPASPAGDPGAPSNVPGLRHVSFAVEDLDAVLDRLRALGAELVGTVEQYEDRYRLCYVRGPEGIIVELAQPLA
jgi:catechol 2,3-dioxygenase-like lactoylglutathione lyase family enzyme